MEFLGEFLLNLGEFQNFKILDEIPFKKCVVLHLFSTKCIMIF